MHPSTGHNPKLFGGSVPKGDARHQCPRSDDDAHEQGRAQAIRENFIPPIPRRRRLLGLSGPCAIKKIAPPNAAPASRRGPRAPEAYFVSFIGGDSFPPGGGFLGHRGRLGPCDR